MFTVGPDPAIVLGIQRAIQVGNMEDMEEKKGGFKFFKMIGIAAVLGVVVAVGRIVFKVFSGKPESGDTPEGA